MYNKIHSFMYIHTHSYLLHTHRKAIALDLNNYYIRIIPMSNVNQSVI